MGSVEAAASLFGSSDSGSDLDFLTAPERGNSASESPAPGSGARTSSELFASQDSPGLFDISEGVETTSSLPESHGEPDAHTYGQNETHSSQTEAYQPNNAHGYGQEAQSSSNHGVDGYPSYAKGWYDESGQWHSYEHREGTSAQISTNVPSSTVGSPNNSAGTRSYPSSNTDSRYGVQAGDAMSYRYQAAYVPPSSSAQSAYDPYKPVTPAGLIQTSPYDYTDGTSAYNPLRPLGIASQQTPPSPFVPTTQSPYDPYKPVTPSTLSPPAASPSPFPQVNTYAAGASLIPQPSTVDTATPPTLPYRPSTANAYDPPISAVRPKKSFTASAFQHQSSSNASPNATSPPLPPARRVSSPPRGHSSLSPGPPPRSSVYSPPKHSTVSYAQPSAGVGRSSSPYDPPILRQHEPPRSYSPRTSGYPHPHVHEQHRPPASSLESRGHPELKGEAVYSQELSNINPYHGSVSNRDSGVHSFSHDMASTPIERKAELQEVLQLDQSVLSPSEKSDDAAAEYRTSSRPTSTHSSPNRRTTSRSPASERRVRMSPDVTSRYAGSQRAISPVSESGRSQQSSVGRSSPLSRRTKTSFVGQSFSALDEQSSRHNEPYGFVARTSLDRSDSPGAGSVGSLKNHAVPPATVPTCSYSHEDRDAIDLSGDAAPVNGSTISPVQQNQPFAQIQSTPHDSYRPKPAEVTAQKLSGESSLSVTQRTSDPYAPPPSTYQAPETRGRSMSNISSLSTSSSVSYDPYAPSAQTVKPHEPSPYAGSSYASPPAAPSFGSFTGVGRSSLESSYSPPPVSGPYAPSPSLLGLNDPLGRANARVPVVSFGFGGKLVTCFHSPPALNTGFDVALSSRKCTDVHIRLLHKAIPDSALSVSSASYPGPLVGDPGSPVTTLARAATSANAKSKTKKSKVLAYLDERAEELERGLGYLTAGSVDKRRADGKLTLVRLLHVLVEQDGQLYGSSAAECATRAAILPRLANLQDAAGANVYLNAPTGASLATGTFGSATSNEKPLAEYSVRRSALETLQDFLLRGEKRKAYHYALDERMWAHAMVISSGIDKEAFKEVVSEFIRTELGVKADSRPDVPVANGLESLRLAYSLYSGQSSTAVQHLLPMKSLQTLQAGPSLTLQPPTPVNHMTPLSPNFPPPSLATNISPDILSQWPEYAAMLFSGQMGAESSSALTTLGDYLISNDWVEAAHCCYLLSPQSSPISGVGAPSVRIVLVGTHSPHRNATFFTDPDAFIFSEILEYALTLHQPAKGQELFSGFPHLQAYRLIRAFQLAEIGQTATAKRYCEAITSTASRSSPYLSPHLLDQLRELYNRLCGIPELDKSNTLFGGKLAKPSLDNFGGWLEGKLSKFVAGEENNGSHAAGEHPTENNHAYVNAFSHYSNISSTNNSRGASPAPSFVSQGVPFSTVPARTASASGFRSVPTYSPNIRSSPTADNEKSGSARNTPPSRMFSADSTFHQSQAGGGYGHVPNANGHPVGNGTAVHEEEGEKLEGRGGWWSAAYGDSDSATPTANAFSRVDSQPSESESGGSGFVSLMDNYSSFTPSPSNATFTNKKVQEVQEVDYFDDDLGFSNSSLRKKTDKEDENQSENENKSKPEKEEVKKEESKKPGKLLSWLLTKPDVNKWIPETRPEVSSSGSWFSRWFNRPSSTKPAPIKANLGEETSFYYDKELKRWVNKKAGAEPAKPAALPPPPSRAQTASPSRSAHSSNSGPPPASPMPPPRRPLSAMASGSSAPPRKTLAPVHSNLIPEESSTAPASAPPTPAVMTGLTATPPAARPKSAARRSARSRYVDVFQQPS